MNTPTPEHLQELSHRIASDIFDINKFNLSMSDCSWNEQVGILISGDDGLIVLELIRKLAALQEKVDYWVEHWNLRDVQATKLQQQLTASQEQNTNLLGKLATTEQNLAISQERVKELEKHLDTLNAKLDDVAKKLRNIY